MSREIGTVSSRFWLAETKESAALQVFQRLATDKKKLISSAPRRS
jgi:hypothetical protein